MALRYRVVASTVKSDQSLSVTYVLAWTDVLGTEVWTDNRTRSYPPGVSTAQVLADLETDAVNAAPLIQAAIGLAANVGHTYELQNGAWVKVS